MLAYVFWHWPQPHIDRSQYVEHLIDFQRTLAANKPAGFRESMVYRLRGANWLKTDGEAYEDWYLLDDSAAMDRLNEGAVTGACEEPHHRVAREAEDGIAGLYQLHTGQVEQARFATWLSKPDGVSYREFYETVGGVTLWQRQMVLGPTTEFCIHSSEPRENSIALELIWPQI